MSSTVINEATVTIRNAIRPPTDADFADADFLADPGLQMLADFLRDKYDLPTEIHVEALWKRKGGKSRGKSVYGKAVLTTSGLAGYYSGETEAVVWLAADHITAAGWDARRIEAALHHELLHVGADDQLTPTLIAHDFAGFTAELDRYGCWYSDLMDAKLHFEQARLDL